MGPSPAAEYAEAVSDQFLDPIYDPTRQELEFPAELTFDSGPGDAPVDGVGAESSDLTFTYTEVSVRQRAVPPPPRPAPVPEPEPPPPVPQAVAVPVRPRPRRPSHSFFGPSSPAGEDAPDSAWEALVENSPSPDYAGMDVVEIELHLFDPELILPVHAPSVDSPLPDDMPVVDLVTLSSMPGIHMRGVSGAPATFAAELADAARAAILHTDLEADRLVRSPRQLSAALASAAQLAAAPATMAHELAVAGIAAQRHAAELALLLASAPENLGRALWDASRAMAEQIQETPEPDLA